MKFWNIAVWFLVLSHGGLEGHVGAQDATQEVSAENSGPPPLHLSDEETEFVDGLLEDAREAGDAIRGLTVFTAVKMSCFSCHKVGSLCADIGPELNGVSQRRQPREIVASLFWPNRQVETRYRTVVVATSDGSIVRGYRQAEDAQQLIVRDPGSNVQTAIPRDEIEEIQLGNSPMPEELMKTLSRQQQIDLIRLLLDVGRDPALDPQHVDAMIAHAVGHKPVEFPWVRDPLEPARWPSWQAVVNRDRLYDFYAKQADYFRQRPHAPLLQPAPELDSGKYGHWGNQDESIWKSDGWNQTKHGSLQCGVFIGDGITVPRGTCVKVGDAGDVTACFNPDTLQYEIVWRGFVKFSDGRHGFLDGMHQNGTTLEKPHVDLPSGAIKYHGFYRHGSRVVFAYRIGDTEYLDSPWFESGRFVRRMARRDEHPLREWTRGGTPQWPETMVTKIHLGSDSPYTIDTIELPTDNPWQAEIFGSDHGFLPDGSAYLTSMPGDVWYVNGFSGQAGDQGPAALPTFATWRRFAAGLHQPLGMVVSPDGIFVMCRDQLLRLHDLNSDGEADFYECYSNQHQTSGAAHDFICGLQRDPQGNFYTASGNQGLIRFSADGSSVRTLATGFRNPDGLGLTSDGVVTVPGSEGDWTPASMICAVRLDEALRRPADDPLHFGRGGPQNSRIPDLPMLYLPRNMDNSSGGQVQVSSEVWGPLKGQLLHFSFGMACHFLVLRDEVDGQVQAAAVPLAGEFQSGSHRGRFSPVDGQLYVSGMGGWGNYSPELGCFQRVRYSGGRMQSPIGYRVHENGIAIRFIEPIDAKVATNTTSHFAQAWNYRYSGSYGSAEYAPGHEGILGHVAWQIARAHVLDDGRTLFLELPELQPVNQLHLRLHVDGGRGHELFCTVHRLGSARTDLPGYRPIAKKATRHPIELDMELANKRKPNPWRESIAGARELRIEAGTNLSYSTKTLHAKAGETLAVHFHNPDVVPHNWALVRPGALERVGRLANQLITDPDAFVNHYVPSTDDVMVYTDIVESRQGTTIFFRAPEQPGRYPYLCTFPGHWMVMNGELIVE